jgi:N-acylneuraminate cytidylyltransferase
VSAICIIPARGGSRRIPRKNIKPFHGKPIIAYSIRCAQELDIFDAIFVSTDDSVVADVARDYGVASYTRPSGMGENHVGTQAVMVDALNALAWGGEYACCLYATCPLLLSADLLRGFHECEDNERRGYSMSVGPDPLRDAGQFYWGPTWRFLARRPLIDADTVMVPLDEHRVCDINTPEDWKRAEKMYEELQ